MIVHLPQIALCRMLDEQVRKSPGFLITSFNNPGLVQFLFLCGSCKINFLEDEIHKPDSDICIFHCLGRAIRL